MSQYSVFNHPPFLCYYLFIAFLCLFSLISSLATLSERILHFTSLLCLHFLREFLIAYFFFSLSLFFILVREYSQMVRQQVESIGIMVEMRQLSPTFSLLEALDSAAKRGFLYTIIITSQHEAHRSVTLTILHGRNPQG